MKFHYNYAGYWRREIKSWKLKCVGRSGRPPSLRREERVDPTSNLSIITRFYAAKILISHEQFLLLQENVCHIFTTVCGVENTSLSLFRRRVRVFKRKYRLDNLRFTKIDLKIEIIGLCNLGSLTSVHRSKNQILINERFSKRIEDL